MKKIMIFGATGTIGRQLVTRALQDGYAVSAFVRNRSKVTENLENLTIVEGNVFDNKSIELAIKGHDAVIVVLGDGRKGVVRAKGTENIISAMQKTELRRLICQSTLGTGDSNDKLNFLWKHIMFGWFLKEAFQDHECQENLVKNSGLDWTIVRPAAFTDGPATNLFKHGSASQKMRLKLKISRADVVTFLLKQISDKSYMYQSPILSY